MGKDMARPGLGQDLVTIRAPIGRDEAYSADGSGSSHMAARKAITDLREAITGVTSTCTASRLRLRRYLTSGPAASFQA
jgi:hypothetical protein